MKLELSQKSKGNMTIELAFTLPAMLGSLFLILNHYRFYEIKSKIKSSAFLAASMIQNVTNTRTDKTLTKNDFRQITFASSLNLFLNDTVFTGSRGTTYRLTIKYGKRTASGYEGLTIVCNTANANKVSSIAYSGASSTTNNSGISLASEGDEGMSVTAELIPAGSTSYNPTKMGFFNFKINSFVNASMPAIRSNFKYEVKLTPKPDIINRSTLNGS